MNKSTIRNKILKIRKLHSFKNLSINPEVLISVLKRDKIIRKTVGAYYPYNYEVDLMLILEKFVKKKYLISLPKIRKNNQMDFFKWSLSDPLTINKYGIPEPVSSKITYPDILLIPMVAFDKDFNRLGYGGGFYDRYIKKLKNKKKIITIGLAYSFQRVKKIPTNKHDVKLDFIVTEKTKLK
mgnify:CR=1 FL=1